MRAVGGTVEEAVDVRIISATHKNLSDMMAEGCFRQDLYYRLNVIQLKMPALREHREDIPELTDRLLEKLCNAQSISAPTIDASARKLIEQLPLSGNVRELENMLERALALCDEKIIFADDLLMETESQTVKAKTTDFEPSKELDVSLSDHLEDIEKRAILKALEKTNNKTAAAKLLGVSFRG